MFDVGEYERGFDDVADLAWACCDVAERAPAADQQGEAAFAQAAQPRAAGRCRRECPGRAGGRRRAVLTGVDTPIPAPS